MTDAIYWIWLQKALGISSSLRTQEIVDAFGGAGAATQIFESSDYERRISGVFTNLQLERLGRTPFSEAEKIAGECAARSVHILSPDDGAYPARLRELMNFPLALYVLGSLDCLRQRLGIAIVGTRRADRKSVDIAARLSGSLVRAGCVIVSGGALGIDSAAHRGALSAGGKTVAILGCGLWADYLPENGQLRGNIMENGALVSEYPCDSPPLARHFPTRNRIISGMTVGTVVVEAGERSGSLITATCAAEQGRDVFAVPGDAFGSTYMGANKLIREGAKPVFSAMDVLEEYELLYPELLDMRRAERHLERRTMDPAEVPVKAAAPPKKARPAPKQQKAPARPKEPAAPARELSQEQRNILELLEEEALHIDALRQRTELTPGALSAALITLEMDGLVRQTPGKIYEIANAEA
ncbi:MAG: DNA-processing protein DprA [Oscillospiraceae bacterium]|nr:DNA-processing protein DprA [Oscillospiraceae bacterium]